MADGERVTVRLDGITFEVTVHPFRDPNEARGGPWLVRVYAAGEHVHSAEGGVPLDEAKRAMSDWLPANGANVAKSDSQASTDPAGKGRP